MFYVLKSYTVNILLSQIILCEQLWSIKIMACLVKWTCKKSVCKIQRRKGLKREVSRLVDVRLNTRHNIICVLCLN